MAEFWLISAPGDRSPQQTWEKCKVASKDLSLNNKFSLPELKVSIGWFIEGMGHLTQQKSIVNVIRGIKDCFARIQKHNVVVVYESGSVGPRNIRMQSLVGLGINLVKV